DDAFEAALVRDGHAAAARLFVDGGEGLIDELRRFSKPLWSYATDAVQKKLHAVNLLGIDAQGIGALGRRSDIDLVQTPWWDRVVQLQIRAGVPLFALTCMPDLWRAYANEPNPSQIHLDQRWATWPELLAHDFPRPAIERFAQAIALGLIPVSDGL